MVKKIKYFCNTCKMFINEVHQKKVYVTLRIWKPFKGKACPYVIKKESNIETVEGKMYCPKCNLPTIEVRFFPSGEKF